MSESEFYKISRDKNEAEEKMILIWQTLAAG
jgi:hypothetical protein